MRLGPERCWRCSGRQSQEGDEWMLCASDGCGCCGHVQCAGITAAPEGEWLCPDCAFGVKEVPELEEASNVDDWFELKRWMGSPQQIAAVYSQISRTQAIALLDGFCRADGEWKSIQYDDDGEPTGCWVCGHSSFPLIDHLQLMGQLAGAAVDLRLEDKAGYTVRIDEREVISSVNSWMLSFHFTHVSEGHPVPDCTAG